jgi:hypothetical protein
MAAKLLNFRCPDDIRELIESRATETGEDKSRIVVDALRYALGLADLPSDAVIGKSKLLEVLSRVDALERKYQRLAGLIANAE